MSLISLSYVILSCRMNFIGQVAAADPKEFEFLSFYGARKEFLNWKKFREPKISILEYHEAFEILLF